MRELGLSTGLVAFLDDDVVLRPDAFEHADAFSTAHPDVAVFSGRLLCDGGPVGRLERAEGETTLREDATQHMPPPTDFHPGMRLYGCDMYVRAETLAQVSFDESLPGYIWLEDWDFSNARLVARNAVGALGRGHRIDYRGRVLGNLRALRDWAAGSLHPERYDPTATRQKSATPSPLSPTGGAHPPVGRARG